VIKVSQMVDRNLKTPIIISKPNPAASIKANSMSYRESRGELI